MWHWYAIFYFGARVFAMRNLKCMVVIKLCNAIQYHKITILSRTHKKKGWWGRSWAVKPLSPTKQVASQKESERPKGGRFVVAFGLFYPSSLSTHRAGSRTQRVLGPLAGHPLPAPLLLGFPSQIDLRSSIPSVPFDTLGANNNCWSHRKIQQTPDNITTMNGHSNNPNSKVLVWKKHTWMNVYTHYQRLLEYLTHDVKYVAWTIYFNLINFLHN